MGIVGAAESARGAQAMTDVARLCLGTAALGLPGYGLASGHRPDCAESAAILRRAYELGITHFDTGAAYGDAEDWLLTEPAFRCGVPGISVSTKLSSALVRRGAERDGFRFSAVLLHNPTIADLQDANS